MKKKSTRNTPHVNCEFYRYEATPNILSPTKCFDNKHTYNQIILQGVV